MKILLYTDVHFSLYASIVRSVDGKYSIRLKNLIESINWAEKLAIENKCDSIFVLGDFFDKAEVIADEMTALSEVKWSGLGHTFLVGNHEMSRSSLELSSAHIFNLLSKTKVIDSPTIYKDKNGTQLCFLPYVVNPDKPIMEYFTGADFDNSERRVIFSHNDIKGINYGAYVSQSGFEISDIENHCDLFLNGHLHDRCSITNKVINIGSLSAHNFTNDSFKYSYGASILDTETLELKFYENPYSFNFYKFETDSVKDCKKKLDKTKQNAVLTIQCSDKDLDEIKKLLVSYSNVVESRVILDINKKETTLLLENKIEELTKLDHIKTFKEYIINTLGKSDIVNEELEEISK